MTPVAMPVQIPVDSSHYVSGVSEDALAIRRMLWSIEQFPDPMAFSSHKGESFERLDTVFQASCVDDWDGNGAIAVVPSTFHYARQFLALLPSRIEEPEIYAETDGEIAFEWDFGRRQILSVSIGRDGRLSYAALTGLSRLHGVEHISQELPATIKVALERVIGGR